LNGNSIASGGFVIQKNTTSAPRFNSASILIETNRLDLPAGFGDVFICANGALSAA